MSPAGTLALKVITLVAYAAMTYGLTRRADWAWTALLGGIGTAAIVAASSGAAGDQPWALGAAFAASAILLGAITTSGQGPTGNGS